MKTTPTHHIASAELGITRIRREIETLRYQFGIDMQFMDDAHFEQFVDEATRRMVLSIQAKVAAKKYEVKTVRFPSDWWQAFKLRFFPANWLKKWPVQWDEVTLEANAYHPDIAIPDRQTFVEIVMASRNRIYQDWPDSSYSDDAKRKY